MKLTTNFLKHKFNNTFTTSTTTNKLILNKFNKTLLYQPSSFKSLLTMQNINPNLIEAEYQVRGVTVIRSAQIAQEIANGSKDYAFEKLIQLNIGNPQSLGQLPITFPREVIGCLFSNISQNKDAVNRAEYYKKELSGIEGYTHYTGMACIRRNVARFIRQRDSCEVDKEDIMLSNGAGGGIRLVLETLLNSKDDAVMTPIPQYPLYSAAIRLHGCHLAGYNLDEDNKWGMDLNNIQEVYKKHYNLGQKLKAFVVLNPGNPTGNILSEENIQDMIKFCYDHKMAIIADEVYQNNIYDETKQFHSLRKVLSKMPHPYNQTMLFSFNSVSKGYYGECGLRGGYLDMFNVPDVMKSNLLKLKSLEICPNIIGQLSMDLLIKPPTIFDSSEETVNKYRLETQENLLNLKEKANLLSEKLNSMERFTCNKIEGAMYAFPKIDMSEKVIKEAKNKNIQPDLYYCLELLEKTGIILVPGSGFGQKEGTHHIRITNLVNPKAEMVRVLERVEEFNRGFF